MLLLFYSLILFSLLFSSPAPVLLFGFFLPRPLHCSMDVSWLSPWLCYFDLLLTMLSTFGESPWISLPSVWGECSSYLNEYLRFEDFFFLNRFIVTSTLQQNLERPGLDADRAEQSCWYDGLPELKAFVRGHLPHKVCRALPGPGWYYSTSCNHD